MEDIDDAMESAIETMKTRSDFGDFLDLLIADCEENLDYWTNKDLQSFLYGLRQYARAPELVSDDIHPEKPTWASFADMLSVARAFE